MAFRDRRSRFDIIGTGTEGSHRRGIARWQGITEAVERCRVPSGDDTGPDEALGTCGLASPELLRAVEVGLKAALDLE